MNQYPEILIPKSSYPVLKDEDLLLFALVRETVVNVYTYLTGNEYEPDDILPLVVAPQPSLREVFELWVKDNDGNRIPRDKSNTRTRYLAKSILEYIIAEAIIYKETVIPFKRSEFE